MQLEFPSMRRILLLPRKVISKTITSLHATLLQVNCYRCITYKEGNAWKGTAREARALQPGAEMLRGDIVK